MISILPCTEQSPKKDKLKLDTSAVDVRGKRNAIQRGGDVPESSPGGGRRREGREREDDNMYIDADERYLNEEMRRLRGSARFPPGFGAGMTGASLLDQTPLSQTLLTSQVRSSFLHILLSADLLIRSCLVCCKAVIQTAADLAQTTTTAHQRLRLVQQRFFDRVSC